MSGPFHLTATAGRYLDPEKDYSEMLLSHARLYVFTDMYQVQGLRELATK